MKLSMLKLLIAIILLNISLSAKTLAQKITSYERHRLRQDQRFELKDLKQTFSQKLSDGWTGYVFKIKLAIHTSKTKTKIININDILFSNGTFITSELRSMKGLDLKRTIHPKLDKRYYTDSHLIAGNKNAKHKLVLFSDPLCPICTGETPKIIKTVQQHPDIFALYYISYPLDMHPTAKTIAKAAQLLRYKNMQNADYKVYTAHLDKYFDPYTNKNDKKSLMALNKVLGTKLTIKDVNSPFITKQIKSDIKLANDALVNGTPTLFIDGKVDLTRETYKKYIK